MDPRSLQKDLSFSPVFYKKAEKLDVSEFEEKITYPLPTALPIQALFLCAEVPTPPDEKDASSKDFNSRYENSIILKVVDNTVEVYRILNPREPAVHLNDIEDKKLMSILKKIPLENSEPLHRVLSGTDEKVYQYETIWDKVLKANPTIATEAPLAIFMDSDDGTQFKTTVSNLLNDFRKWIQSSWPDPQDKELVNQLNEQIDTFYEKKFSKFFGNTSIDLYREGVPTLFTIRNIIQSDKVSLITRKRVIRELVSRFYVCPPGVNENIKTAFEKLISDLACTFMGIRRTIAENKITDIMLEKKYFDEQHAGYEIHDAKKIVNFFGDPLGITEVSDKYARSHPYPETRPDKPGQMQELYDIGQDFRIEIQRALTPEIFLNHLFIDHIDDIVTDFIDSINKLDRKDSKDRKSTDQKEEKEGKGEELDPEQLQLLAERYKNIKTAFAAFQDRLNYYGDDETYEFFHIVDEDHYNETEELRLLPENKIKQYLKVSFLERLKNLKLINNSAYVFENLNKEGTFQLNIRNKRYLLLPIGAKLPETIPDDAILIKLAAHQITTYKMQEGVLTLEKTLFPNQFALAKLDELMKFDGSLREINELQHPEQFSTISTVCNYLNSPMSLDLISVTNQVSHQSMPLLDYFAKQYSDDAMEKIPYDTMLRLLSDDQHLAETIRSLTPAQAEKFYAEYKALFSFQISTTLPDPFEFGLHQLKRKLQENTLDSLGKALAKIPNSHFNSFLKTVVAVDDLKKILGAYNTGIIPASLFEFMVKHLNISSWQDFLHTDFMEPYLPSIISHQFDCALDQWEVLMRHKLFEARGLGHFSPINRQEVYRKINLEIITLFEICIPQYYKSLREYHSHPNPFDMYKISKSLVPKRSQVSFIENYAPQYGIAVAKALIANSELDTPAKFRDLLASYSPENRGRVINWFMSQQLKPVIADNQSLIEILDLLSKRADRLLLLNKLGFEAIKDCCHKLIPLNNGRYLIKVKPDSLNDDFIYGEGLGGIKNISTYLAANYKAITPEQYQLVLSSSNEFNDFLALPPEKARIELVEYIGIDFTTNMYPVRLLSEKTDFNKLTAFLFNQNPLWAFEKISQWHMTPENLMKIIKEMNEDPYVAINKIVNAASAAGAFTSGSSLLEEFITAFPPVESKVILEKCFEPGVLRSCIRDEESYLTLILLLHEDPTHKTAAQAINATRHAITLLGTDHLIDNHILIKEEKMEGYLYQKWSLNNNIYYSCITNLETDEMLDLLSFIFLIKNNVAAYNILLEILKKEPGYAISAAQLLYEDPEERIAFLEKIKPDFVKEIIQYLAELFYTGTNWHRNNYTLSAFLALLPAVNQVNIMQTLPPFEAYIFLGDADARAEAPDKFIKLDHYQKLEEKPIATFEKAIVNLSPSELKYLMVTQKNAFIEKLSDIADDPELMPTLFKKVGDVFFQHWIKTLAGLSDLNMSNLTEEKSAALVRAVVKHFTVKRSENWSVRWIEKFDNNPGLRKQMRVQYFLLQKKSPYETKAVVTDLFDPNKRRDSKIDFPESSKDMPVVTRQRRS